MTIFNNTILITGSSSGIGEQCAQTCLNNGYKVVGLARDFSKSSLQHKNYTSIECDLNKPEQLEKTIKSIIKEHQPNQFLHSAGFGRFGSIEQFSSVQILQMIQVNLVSALLISRLLVPHFRKQKNAKMVFIGSESAITAGKKGAVYCASKFGLRGFVLALREDCAADDIGVSLINPGMVDSPFFKALDFAPKNSEKCSISTHHISKIVQFILSLESHLILDEINCSPAIKSIDFSKKAE